jgi:peptidoglycan DL-endopeptidase CwlO
VRKTPITRCRGVALLVALLAATATLVGFPGFAPTAAVAVNPPDEGDNKKLRDALEAASKGHLEAKAKYENSKKRQLELTLELNRIEEELTDLHAAVNVVAVRSYRMGRLGPVSALLNSASPQAFAERATSLEMVARHGDRQLRDLIAAREQAARAKAAIDAEVAEQKKQVAVMAKRKEEAERALASVSSGASGGFINPNSPLAKPAPRNADGSWPPESCTVDDPTTSGCITPRTLHALNQAKAAGFTRYVSCYRSGGSGEHPKGRACDFSAAVGGFKNVHATGGDKTYGDNLTSFFVKNADRLGVLYVIWYRQIWLPGTGWRSYNGGTSPAGAHTNHVHVSII